MPVAPPTRSLKERVRSKADEYNVDIDAVREIDTNGSGTTLRIVETDAPDEVDQVGVQITYPDTKTGDMMFSDQLTGAIRQLRDYVDDTGDGNGNDNDNNSSSTDDNDTVDANDGTGSDTDADDSDMDELERLAQNESKDTDTSDSSADEGSQSSTHSDLSTTVTLEFDQDSLDEFKETIESSLPDEQPDMDHTEDIEGRLDAIEDRLDDIESAFAVLSSD